MPFFPCYMRNSKVDDDEFYLRHVDGCSICQYHKHNYEELLEKKLQQTDVFKYTKISFVRLLNFLMPNVILNQESCEIKFPDSIFFDEEGKAMFIARTGKNGKICKVTDPKQLKLANMRQKFS